MALRGQSNQTAAKRNGGWPAFTLLEVLLALGLSVVLLVALNTALDLYRRYTTAGRNDIEQSQLARALLAKIADDLRSAVAPPPSPGFSGSSSSSSSGSSSSSSSGGSSSSSGSSSSGSSPSSGSSSTADDATSVMVVDPAAAYSKAVVGVLGDSETLVLTVCRPGRPLAPAAATGEIVPLPMGDTKSVSYFLAVDGAEGLRGLVVDPTAPAIDTGDDIRGLARLEGDRLSIAQADLASDNESLALYTRLLAQEVNYLQFRYSDGIFWYDTWDGTAEGLPRAVEIVLGLRLPSGITPAVTSRASSTEMQYSTELYRLVVAIPAAGAMTLESGL